MYDVKQISFACLYNTLHSFTKARGFLESFLISIIKFAYTMMGA